MSNWSKGPGFIEDAYEMSDTVLMRHAVSLFTCDFPIWVWIMRYNVYGSWDSLERILFMQYPLFVQVNIYIYKKLINKKYIKIAKN